MMFWLIAAIMCALVLALLLPPLLRRGAASPASRADFDVEIYRDQLDEIERDLERGVLDADQAAAARTEIGRRLLAVGEEKEEIAQASGGRQLVGAVLLGVVVPVAAFLLYIQGGAPGLVDRPDAPPTSASPGADPHDTNEALKQLAQRLVEKPDDLKGWALMGRSLYSLKRYAESAAAYGNAVALAPGRADLMGLQGEALTFANNGTVTPRARQLFEGAVTLEAGEDRARYYLGLADSQSGRGLAALERWRAMVADAPPDAPWLGTVRRRVERLAGQLGVDAGLPAARTAQRPGPSAADIEASRDMSADDRQAMIRSMVARLAARLEKQPDDAEGWKQLGRSYQVLGEEEKSRAAFARAAGLTQKGLTAADVAAARDMPAGDRQAMIRSMVARLAARLEKQPDDAEGWMRLGRSYRVLGDAIKSRDAFARAAGLMPDDRRALALHANAMLEALPAGATPPKAFDAAIARLVARDPDSQDALWLLGVAARRGGRADEAAGHWRKLLSFLKPGSAEHARLTGHIESLKKP